MAWHLGANHAGGYSYRLCKMPEGGIGDLTEECFQQNPLDFVGDIQWIEYQKDKNTGFRTELEALQTTEGTHPAGSMWRANQGCNSIDIFVGPNQAQNLAQVMFGVQTF